MGIDWDRLQPPQRYEFDERRAMSSGVASSTSIEAILLANIPGAVAVRAADEAADRMGTDWWVDHVSGHSQSVDAKVREEDFARKGCDDLALETLSVVERNKVGWTLDETKRTDYILWLWKDTQRWCLVPFPMLCQVFKEHL
jgi:hypothetical protein